MAELKLQK